MNSAQIKVICGIPSLNKAHSIAFVVEKAGVGPCALIPPERVLILNIDSGSCDETVKNFRSTKTQCRKPEVHNDGGIQGKGRNLWHLFQTVKEVGAEYALALDADLTLEIMWRVYCRRVEPAPKDQ